MLPPPLLPPFPKLLDPAVSHGAREQDATAANEAEEDDESEDPRWELIRKLVEYKKFKDAADKLEVLEHEQEDVYPRRPA